MHRDRAYHWLSSIMIGTMVINAASAQSVALKRRGSTSTTVTVTMEGQQKLVSIKASNVDVRTLFQDIGIKAGARVLLATNVEGVTSPAIENEPLDTAIVKAAATANLIVRKLVVPETLANTLKPAAAAYLAGALTANVSTATATDPVTGKSVLVTALAKAPVPASGQALIYFVMKAPRYSTGDKVQDAVADAAESLNGLTAPQRMQVLRTLQQQAMQSMTPEDRAQMRPQGGPGGPGGGMDGGAPPAPGE